MVQDLLVLGSGLGAVAGVQVRFTANVHGPVGGAIRRSAEFVRGRGLEPSDGLGGIVALNLGDRLRYRNPDTVEHSVGGEFLGQLLDEFRGLAGVPGTRQRRSANVLDIPARGESECL